jgi:predicted DNA-binding protein YlxM (UPF0122 family)
MVISKEDIQELYYDQQLTLAETGEALGFTGQHIMWYMDKYNMPRRTKSVANTKTEISKEELERLYIIEEHSAGEIAQKYDLCTSSVTRKLKKYGIPLRSLSESRKRWGNKKYNGSSPRLKFIIDKSTLKDLYTSKCLSTFVIAEMYNVSPTTVSNKLRKFNIPIRSPSETMVLNGYYDSLKQMNKNSVKSTHFVRYPNVPELKMFYILQKIAPNLWEYTGDGNRIIDGLCPDFICESKKKIIEIFGDYWHDSKKRKLNWRKTQPGRESTFNKHGYDLLVVWEHELEDISKTIDKTLTFIGGDFRGTSNS